MSVPRSTERVNEILEILGLAKSSVDRGEPHIGDRIESGMRRHHPLAYLLRRNLGHTGGLELTNEAADHAFDALVVHGPLPQRHPHRALGFVPVERLALTVGLNDHEFAQIYPLERGAACAAAGTEAATRSEEHTTELQSLMRISYDVFCFKKNNI